MHIEYTKRLFNMIPKELVDPLKKCLTMTFDQRPDYEGTIQALKICLNKSIIAQRPSCPPTHSPSVANHEFEWSRSIAT